MTMKTPSLMTRRTVCRRAVIRLAVLAAAGGLLSGRPAADETPADAVPGAEPAAGHPPAREVRVLIVTGIDYPGHHWKETAPVLKSLLEADPRLRVDIVEDPAFLGSPRLHDWQVVVLHFMNWQKPGPGPEARRNLERFVADGGGLALTHFACGAWHGEWPEFVKLAGRVWFGQDGGRQHDPRGRFTVEIAAPEHPVVRGMQAFETDDELYTCLEGDTPIEVLATARSKVDGRDYPMAFVLRYGRGRVFHTVLGHDVRAYTYSPAVGELLRRGVAWAAGVEPVPARQTR